MKNKEMTIYDKVTYYLNRPTVSASEMKEAIGNVFMNDEIVLTKEQSEELVKKVAEVINSHDPL